MIDVIILLLFLGLIVFLTILYFSLFAILFVIVILYGMIKKVFCYLKYWFRKIKRKFLLLIF